VHRKNWPKLFRQEVGQSRQPRNALVNLRSQIATGEIEELFEALKGNQVFVSATAPSAFPRALEKLSSSRRLTPISLMSSLKWCSEVVLVFSEQIRSFLEAEKSFEAAYIRKDFIECTAALDALESRFGLSLWLIARRIAVEAKDPASDANFAAQLIASDSSKSLASWLIYMMDHRANANVSPVSYLQNVVRTIRSTRLDGSMQTFLRYYALSAFPTSSEECLELLTTTETAPVFDRYITLLDCCQFICGTFTDGSPERKLVGDIAARVTSLIGDDRFQLITQIVDRQDPNGIAQRLDLNGADSYTEGNYFDAIENFYETLTSNPDRIELYELLCRAIQYSEAQVEVPSCIQYYIGWMSDIQEYSINEDTALINLQREILLSGHRGLSALFRAHLSNRSAEFGQINIDSVILAMNSRRLTPQQLRHLTISDQFTLIDSCLEIFPDSISLKLQKSIIDAYDSPVDQSLLDMLPAQRRDLYAAHSLYKRGKIHDACDLLRGLEKSEIAVVRNDALRELFKAFVATEDWREAIRLVARAYRKNKRLHILFRLEKLLDNLEVCYGDLPFDEISLSICYLIFNNHTGGGRVGSQADAAEEFVLSRGVNLPSKLDISLMGDDLDLLPIFLDQVCTPSVLDKFMAIDNIDHVERERLGICRILVEIDSSERQKYLEEIREITRRRVVRDRFEQVERTKIYVDTEGIKRQAEKNLRDNYQRFISMISDPSNSSERIEMMRRVQKVLSDVRADGIKIHFKDLPSNETDQVFDHLVRDVMRLLVSSQEYGLEAYLSTRVRHGTIGNQLRSAFEVQALLTQKDGEAYQPHEYWPDHLGLMRHDGGEWLANRLAQFSAELDAKIEELVKGRIQVRSDVTPDGLFVFQSYNYDTLRLQSEIVSDTSLDNFLERVIEQFWSILEGTLVYVRRHIETEFMEGVHDLINELDRDVVTRLPSSSTGPLRDAIAAARTQMLVNVANVANWFTIARDMEKPDFEFGIAVEVATESIRACHPGLNIALKRPDQISFDCRGKTLETLVYILFTALDNAIEHGGFYEAAPEITLETTLNDGWLVLKLSNDCVPVCDFSEINSQLSALRDRLESESEVTGLATTEGGSGYAKIVRMLRHDLLARHSLDFGYESAARYSVTIGMDARSVLK